jgi:acetyl-CoA acetyltransferase
MNHRAFVAGVAIGQFGRHPETNAEELGAATLRQLLAETSLDVGRVDRAFVGSTYSGSLIGQRVLRRVGYSGPPVFTVENACASGASAVHLGWEAIAGGRADVVIAVGVEHLSGLGRGTLPLTAGDVEIKQGLVMPAAYAMRAQRYLYEHGATTEDLARVVVKNRANGASNPRAHLRQAVTLEEVLAARMIADPLTMLHCCPNSDGAAAVVLAGEGVARDLGTPLVEILASVVRSGRFHTAPRELTWADITARTTTAALEQARVGIGDLDLIELHDAFSVAELVHLESMGVTPRGKAFQALADGTFERDGDVAVNPSGGLLARGHPVGATGVAQIAETYWQLTGSAGDLQVPGAELALTHVTGGGIFGVDNGACGVHILAAAA